MSGSQRDASELMRSLFVDQPRRERSFDSSSYDSDHDSYHDGFATDTNDSPYDSWDDYFEAIERRQEEENDRVNSVFDTGERDEREHESDTRLVGFEGTVDFGLIDFTRDTPAPPADPNLGKEALDGEDACFVCLINRPDSILLACQHGGMCRVCARRLFIDEQRCPLCRHPIPAFQVIGD